MRWFLKEANSSGETWCKKSWDQFEKYGSLSLFYVKQVSGKRKDHRFEKYKSNLNISEVPTLRNLRTGPVKRLKDNSDVPKARLGILPEKYTRTKRTTRPHSTRPPAASTKGPEERVFVVDSGASMHMFTEKDLNSAELEIIRTSRSPTTVTTANSDVQPREEATENVKEWDLFVKVMLLEETPAVLSLGKLCEDHGYTYHWISGQKPHLI